MDTKKEITIKAPRFRVITLRVEGNAPLCMAAFNQKTRIKLLEAMMAGTTGRSKKLRAVRDPDADMRGATHYAEEGWIGFPCSAMRNAMIDACRMVGYKMTHAKMSIFVLADGHDASTGQPLVRLDVGTPERLDMAVRNATGVVDIRTRPMWRTWGANVRIRWDEDQFTVQDVVNLATRAGFQVGIGEGRPFSRESNGIGFGTFDVCTVATTERVA